MLTININNKKAIIVHGTNYALAEYKKYKATKDKEAYSTWVEYCWPSTFESCIIRLTRELVANLNTEVTMAEFKKLYTEMLELIYKRIDGAKTESFSKG